MRLFATAVLTLGLAPATAAQVWIGADAPEIEVKQWFNSESDASISELRGKVIMLEFWATW
jgi:thiol-disulfide isomerase/thioredoxin